MVICNGEEIEKAKEYANMLDVILVDDEFT